MRSGMVDGAARRALLGIASMEPRPCGRGWGKPIDTQERTVLWHRFNGAPTMRSGMEARP
jgi:hypothetical protein